MRKRGTQIYSQRTSRAKARQRAAGARNLAAYKARDPRPAKTHGVYTYLRHGEAPEAVVRQVDAIIAQMVTDLGGESELTAQKRSILAGQRLCLTVLALAERYLIESGLLDNKGKPHALLRVVGSFVNSVRLNAVALGLERRAKPAQTLEDVLREYSKYGAQEERAESTQDPSDDKEK